MIRKSLFLITILVLLISCSPQKEATEEVQVVKPVDEPQIAQPTKSPTQIIEPEKPQLEASNPFHYIVEIGKNRWYYVTGIITNKGDKPIKHVRAKVIYYLNNGTEKQYDGILVWPSRLEPGQKGAFTHQIGKIEEKNQFDIGKYKIEPSSFQIDNKEVLKEVQFIGKRKDDRYFFVTVKNIGDRTLKNYGANKIIYDGAGHVIYASPSLLIPSKLKELKPGETAEFSEVISHPSKTVNSFDMEIEFDYSAVR